MTSPWSSKRPMNGEATATLTHRTPSPQRSGGANELRVQSSVTEAQVFRHCREKNIAVSSVETLPDGRVWLVCMTGYGAAQIGLSLKSPIIGGQVRRQRFGPRQPKW